MSDYYTRNFNNADATVVSTIERTAKGYFRIPKDDLAHIEISESNEMLEREILYTVRIIMEETKKTTTEVVKSIDVPATWIDHFLSTLPRWLRVFKCFKPSFLRHDIVTVVNKNYLCPHLHTNTDRHINFLKRGV